MGRRLLVAGLIPFVAGAASSAWPPAGRAARAWACPVLAVIGQPCPACGSTRAFVALASGHTGWRDANWVIPVYAAGLAALGGALAVLEQLAPAGADRLDDRLHQQLEDPRWLLRLGIVLIAPAWLVAWRTHARATAGDW